MDYLKWRIVCGWLLTGAGALLAQSEREGNFDAGWHFFRGEVAGAEQPAFDDATWRVLEVPHDWSIEDLPANDSTNRVGPFDPDLSPGKDATGNTVGGTGWYRKYFTLPARDSGRTVSARFDGVYMNADIWLNGQPLDHHPYGYTSFALNLTPQLKPAGATNVLAVRVRNEGRNSRWYSGSGIYRHVWLEVSDPLHLAENGLQITTPEVAPENGTVLVKAEIINDRKENARVVVRTTVFDAKGKTVAGDQSELELTAGGRSFSEQKLSFKRAKLWSPISPNLYRAEVALLVAGKSVDSLSESFGIRHIEVDAEHGFRLNGEDLKLKGGCLHHDSKGSF